MTCEPNLAMSNVNICNTLKYYCHDPTAQDSLPLGETEHCQNNWGTIGCCYSGDSGNGCNRDSLLEDATDIYTYRYQKLDRCDNWKWDSSSNAMHLGGDTEVTCATQPTTTTITTTTTTTITTTTTTTQGMTGGNILYAKKSMTSQ